MASILANVPAGLLLHNRRAPTLFRTSGAGPLTSSSSRAVSSLVGRRNPVTVVVKAAGESSESSSTLTIVKSVQNVWDKPEDRIAIIGLGFAAIIGFWASANLVTAIDKLPLIPTVLELVGILYSSWFIYCYLLFKPDRAELFQIINKSISSILGQ